MEKRYIGMELKALNNLIRRYLEQSGNKKEIDRLTFTNAWIIGYIAEHMDTDVFQKDLEREFSITRSTASKVVKLMVQKGFIEQKGIPYDARLKKLVLTPKACEVFESMRSGSKKMETRLIQGFSEEELVNLRNYIERMKKNVEV